MNTTPAISVIMPCYNRAHDLIRTLEAFDRQTGTQPFELIAVDDCSTDRTQEVLRAYRPERYQLTTLRQEVNQGPAAARNRGLEQATGPVILFVGDDILPDPYLVEGHLAAHRSYARPETGILGQVVWADDLPVNTVMQHIQGIGAQQFSYYYLKDNQVYDFRHFYTANVSLKRDFLLSEARLFDPSMRFYEDGELSYRLTKRGFRIVYSKLPVGFHFHYHTVRTFADRQVQAGLGAMLFVGKHPQVRGLITGNAWKLKTTFWRLQAALRKRPENLANDLESMILQNLGVFEWTSHPKLDSFYMAVFSYFFAKGMILGTFGETSTAKKILAVIADRRLSPVLHSLK